MGNLRHSRRKQGPGVLIGFTPVLAVTCEFQSIIAVLFLAHVKVSSFEETQHPRSKLIDC